MRPSGGDPYNKYIIDKSPTRTLKTTDLLGLLTFGLSLLCVFHLPPNIIRPYGPISVRPTSSLGHSVAGSVQCTYSYCIALLRSPKSMPKGPKPTK